jgi:hypothetical protein
VRRGSVVSPAPGRWLSDSRWGDAREQLLHAVRDYAEKNPARYGVMKGELKAGLKTSLDAGLFDQAFAALIADGEIEQTGERVRPGGMPWEPPAAAMARFEKLEGMLEADGFQVPENAAWQKTLGAGAADAAGLGFFLGRLVRVNAELTFTAAQLARLQRLVSEWFEGGHASMTVADFRGITGASRKFGVPLLEHCDRVGWTVRVGDERRKGVADDHVRIALANIRIPEPEESVALAVDAVAKAGAERAAIVCFPEAYVPGYRRGLVRAAARCRVPRARVGARRRGRGEGVRGRGARHGARGSRGADDHRAGDRPRRQATRLAGQGAARPVRGRPLRPRAQHGAARVPERPAQVRHRDLSRRLALSRDRPLARAPRRAPRVPPALPLGRARRLQSDVIRRLAKHVPRKGRALPRGGEHVLVRDGELRRAPARRRRQPWCGRMGRCSSGTRTAWTAC